MLSEYDHKIVVALFGKGLEEAAKDFLREEAAKVDDCKQVGEISEAAGCVRV